MGKFLDECLRMWSPVPAALNRVTQKEMTIGPYKLPANFNVGVSLLSLSHNPKFYLNP